MKIKAKFILWPLLAWGIIFLGSEWWNSHPKVVIPTPLSAQTKSEKIDSLAISTLNENLLSGLSVAIIEDSKISYKKAFGFHKLNEKDSLKPSTVIPVASISKLFTSLSLAGYLDTLGIIVTDPISILNIPEISADSDLGKLSFEQLLRHQSGIHDQSLFQRITTRKASFSIEEFGHELISNSENLESDKSYQYSDSNFDFIGYLLEKSSGQAFQELVQTSMLDHLGMVDSRFNTESIIEYGYRKTRIWKRIKPSPIQFPLVPSPSSGLETTLDDLSKGLIQLTRGDLGLLEKELKWLQTSSELPPAGFQAITLDGHKMIGHFGAQSGFSSLIVFDPIQKTGILILSNTREINDFRINLASQIYTLLLKSP